MVKNLPTMEESQAQTLGWEDPLEGAWQPTPVFLPGESHGQGRLAGCSPWGCKELDTTERLTEKAMTPHCSTLAWKIPWMEEPGGLQSMGSLESDTTEQLHFHFSLSCIGEGNGNPLQCSCLENPRDGGAWWATIYGVAQSRTQLKRLSSSSRVTNTHTHIHTHTHTTFLTR